jgi:ADP-ribose pyrophosphatase YjhB (NUDIX family)
MPSPILKFCSNCAAPLARRLPPGDNKLRYLCDNCGEIHYQNPKMVVGCVPEWEGRLLLCRRAIEPRYGYWTLPAGFMENDETAGEGALRETVEEAGAHVELGDAFSMLSVPHVNQVHIFYRASLIDLNFAPGEESLDVALFEEADIPWKEIAFRTVGITLKRWFEDRKSGAFRFHAEDIAPPPR